MSRQFSTDAAELAVVVADAWQRQGLATRMLAVLADVASDAGPAVHVDHAGR